MFVSSAALALLLTRSEGADGVFRSHVVRSDGNPAAGVPFYLTAYSELSGDIVVEKGQTNANGDLKVSHAVRKGENLEAFIVRCPGQALYFVRAKDLPGEVRLIPGVSAKIEFLLPDGTKGANLLILPKILVNLKAKEQPEYVRIPSDLEPTLGVRTDASGKCSFDDLPAGKTFGFEVSDDRFDRIGYKDRILLKDADNSVKQIRLKKGAAISGRLTREGNPQSNIVVAAQGIGGSMGWGSSTTDARGMFKITKLSPGAYNVALDLKQPMSDHWTGRAQEVSLQYGESKTGIEMKMEKGSLVVGRVVNIEGKPEKDVSIGIYGPAHPQTSAWVQSAQSDSDGAFRFRVPSGEQYVYVMNPGGKSRTLTLGDGKTATVDFQIPTPGKDEKIVGYVKTDSGQVVPNAGVDVLFTGEDPTLGLQHYTTDASGRFSFVKPPAAKTVAILAHTADLGSSQAVSPLKGKEVTVTVSAHQLASASGAVLDETGKPISGAEVQVFMSTGDMSLDTVTAKSGSDGRFTVKELYPGREYGVWAKAQGYGEAHVEHLVLLPGEALNLKQLRLPKADSFLTGIVEDAHGKAAPGATVGIEDMQVLPQTTDAAGRFYIDRIPKGSHTFYAERGTMHVDGNLIAGRLGQVVVLKPLPSNVQVVPFGSEVAPETYRLGSPAVELATKAWVNSKPLKISQLRGKIVVLDFWGIWCRPCVEALPGVERLAQTFRSKGVVVIGIHDSDGMPKEVAAFAKKKGLSYPLTIDQRTSVVSPGITSTKFKVMSFPSLVVIDKNGNVVGTPDTPERAAEMVRHLLK